MIIYSFSAATESPGAPEFGTERQRSPKTNFLVHVFKRNRRWDGRALRKGRGRQVGARVGAQEGLLYNEAFQLTCMCHVHHISHNRSLKKERGRMKPASGCGGTGAANHRCVDKHTLTIILYARCYSNSQHNKVPVLQEYRITSSLRHMWDATVWYPSRHLYAVEAWQLFTDWHCSYMSRTGVTVLISYPSTCHFPASQRLTPATILSHLFLPSRPNFLSKSSLPSQPITHILHHTKLALTCLKPSFSHLDLRKTICIHCLLLTRATINSWSLSFNPSQKLLSWGSLEPLTKQMASSQPFLSSLFSIRYY